MQQFFIPLLVIIANGYFFNSIMAKKLYNYDFTKRLTKDKMTDSLITGTFVLITLMLLVGIFIPGRLYIPVFLYYSLGNFLLLVYFLKNFLNLKNYSSEKATEITQYINTHRIAIIAYIAFYFLLSLIMPERGWDALHYYFPNAIYIYFEDAYRSGLNPLSFFPMFYPPVNSLLIAYTFYFTKTFQANFLPLLFFLAFASFIYRISLMVFEEKTISYLSVIIFFAIPISLIHMYDFAFYQDIFVGLFITASIYYYLDYKKNHSSFSLLLMSFSMVLAVLSKLSGFLFFFILVFSFPQILGKRLTILLTASLGLFLTYKGMEKTYFGTGIVILVLTVILILLIYTAMAQRVGFPVYLTHKFQINGLNHGGTSNDTSIKDNTSFSIEQTPEYLSNEEITEPEEKKETIYKSEELTSVSQKENKPFEKKVLLYTSLPFLTMLLWALWMFQIDGVQDFIMNRYFTSDEYNIRWEFPSGPISQIHTEHGHRATFLSSVLIILTGNVFVSGWMFFKIRGVMVLNHQQQFLTRWVIAFYIFWLAYHSTVSMRYLMPILAPVVIITAKGMFDIKKYLDRRFVVEKWREGSWIFYYLFIFISILYIVPSVPIEYNSFEFQNHSMVIYKHHADQFRLFLYAVGFFLVITIIYWMSLKLPKKWFKRFDVLCLFILISAPFIPVSVMYVTSDYDIDQMQDNYMYYSRPEYRELIQYMINLNLPVSSFSVSVNTPGIEYFIQRPVMDLMVFSSADIRQFTGSYEELFEDLEEVNFRTLIVPSVDHLHFENFMRNYENQFLLRLRNNAKLFEIDFDNGEYQVSLFKGANFNNLGLLTMKSGSGVSAIDFFRLQNNNNKKILNSDNSIRFALSVSDQINSIRVILNYTNSINELEINNLNNFELKVSELFGQPDDKIQSFEIQYLNDDVVLFYESYLIQNQFIIDPMGNYNILKFKVIPDQVHLSA
jgi:hypothetical protein